jgi:RHH-type transcriptional regulator, proline utilization regulon repressor / proline dehydrogenase / delta 1-pyrroline-5-carboxylate dehydrogenase
MQQISFFNIIQKNLTFEKESWTIHFYEGHQQHLHDNLLTQKLLPYIKYVQKKNYQKSFRCNLTLGQWQLMAGIFPEQRKVLLASKQLGHELTLCAGADFPQMAAHAMALATIPLENTPAQIDLITVQYDLADFEDKSFELVESESKKIAAELTKKVGRYRQSYFEKLTDFGLNLTAQYLLIRVHLLKFLAILPSLDHDKHGHEVKRMLLEVLNRLLQDCKTARLKKITSEARSLPTQYIWAIKFVRSLSDFLPAAILASLIRKSVGLMAKRFIAGENIDYPSKFPLAT